MPFQTRTVTHVDGKTKVLVKGLIVNGEFVGEYKFQGMTYGVNITLPLKDTRLDKLNKGDLVLDSKGTLRAISFIKNGMMGINWHSINMEGTSEYILGHQHQTIKKLILD